MRAAALALFGHAALCHAALWVTVLVASPSALAMAATTLPVHYFDPPNSPRNAAATAAGNPEWNRVVDKLLRKANVTGTMSLEGIIALAQAEVSNWPGRTNVWHDNSAAARKSNPAVIHSLLHVTDVLVRHTILC